MPFINKEYLTLDSINFVHINAEETSGEISEGFPDCVMSWQMNQIKGILQEQRCLASLGWDVSKIWDGLPHGNTKPMEIQGAKIISHPPRCSTSSIPQLGQAQGYQHPTSPWIKPSPPFPMTNRMRGCAGEERSRGPASKQMSRSLQEECSALRTPQTQGCPSHKQGWRVTGTSVGAWQHQGSANWILNRAAVQDRKILLLFGMESIDPCLGFYSLFFCILSFPFLWLTDRNYIFSAVDSYKRQRYDPNPALLCIYL